MQPQHASAAARADFYAALARAFEAPVAPGRGAALRELLPLDLAELGAELGLEIDEPLARYAAEAARLPDDTAWLQVYSAIFLAPPVVARINAGWYLDGALNGGSVLALEKHYAEAGVQRGEDFGDLADHVSLQLAFAARLYARAADEASDELAHAAARYLYDFAAGWVGGLCADLQGAAAARDLAANPYLPLALVLRKAVAAHAVPPAVDAKQARHQLALQRARARQAAQGLTADAMEEIRRKLQARGLSTDHLPAAARRACA